jgi:hypothetical protein
MDVPDVRYARDGGVGSGTSSSRPCEPALASPDAVRPLGVEIRVGVLTGETALVGDDVAGAVNGGARVSAPQAMARYSCRRR